MAVGETSDSNKLVKTVFLQWVSLRHLDDKQ